jgi:predicted RNase H-like HicB family nuclease
MAYMAKYTRIPSGYLGQIAEWPEVVTEGKDIDECREMLRDALREMILAYRDLGKIVPSGFDLLEPIAVEPEYVRKTA